MGEYDSELSKIVAELNRAAPSQKTAPGAPRGPQGISSASSASLDQVLQQGAGRGASDILLVAGAPVMLRVTGNLTTVQEPLLAPEDVRSLVLPLLETHQSEELHKNKTVDFGFYRENLGRFRVNIHHQ